MNTESLKKTLESLNISKSAYSINEGLKPDAYILEEVYGVWKFFYLDERGNRRNETDFDNESSACRYLLDRLLFELKYPPLNQK